jgi:hypothetical protein
MQEMRQDFPPRTMFDYIETAKANTEILALLHKESLEGHDMEASTCGVRNWGFRPGSPKPERISGYEFHESLDR